MQNLKRTMVLASAALFVLAMAVGHADAKNATSPAQIQSSQPATPSEALYQVENRGGSTVNEDTYIHFSQAVALPGVVLESGTYLFRHLSPQLTSRRHVVQVLSADRKTVYATLLAIPITRLTLSSKPEVIFSETPVGQPQMIKAWFYPGDNVGDEFVPLKAAASEATR